MPELIALEAELPNTAAAHKNVADLFMQVQDYPRALDEYRRAATLDPADAGALARAGRAAFQLGQYVLAREYLHQAMAHGNSDQASANLVGIVDAVFALNPYAPRITDRKRRARVIRAFRQAGARLRQCAEGHGGSQGATATSFAATQKDSAEWQQLRAHMNERALRRDPDLMDTAMDLVFRIERSSGPQCGPPAAADTALVLISANQKRVKR